jgi:nicotinamidase-related amidase
MTVTALDPQTALILIDLQEGIVALPTVHSAADVVGRSSELAIAFRAHGLPVVLVNVDRGAPGRTESGRRLLDPPASWVQLVPELSTASTDHRVTKQTWGAFTNTHLNETLTGLGVTQVVIAGIATSKGVESTARFASELGYNVTVVVDAITDTSEEAHNNGVANVFPHLGETGTTTEILALLVSSRG